MQTPGGNRRALAIGAIIAACAFALMIVWGVQRSTDQESIVSGATNPALVAIQAEPTTFPTAIPRGDPFQPQGPGIPTQQDGPPSGPPSAPMQPPPMAPTDLPERPSPPPIPTPPPGPPTMAVPGSPVPCSVTLLPGPTLNSVRLVIQSSTVASTLWVSVRHGGEEQSGAVSVYDGYSERVIPGVSPASATVIVYSSPAKSTASESCRFG